MTLSQPSIAAGVPSWRGLRRGIFSEPVAAGLYGGLVVVLLGFSSGGFKPSTWGWAGLVCFAIAATAWLLKGRAELGSAAAVFLGALACFTAWTALSLLWTTSITSTVNEVQRNLSYVSIVAAGVALAGVRPGRSLAAGVTAGVTLLSLYALASRLFPGRFVAFSSASYGYRLTLPITYWNSLGLVAVLALVLCFGYAARGAHGLTRVVGAAPIPALAATAFFTFSRGAWAALAIGLFVAFALDRRRLGLTATALALTPSAALALVAAGRRQGLTHVGATLGEARADGHELFLVLIGLCAVSAAASFVIQIVERRGSVPNAVRRAFAAALVVVLLATAGVVWAKAGSPWHLTRRAWSALNAPPPEASSDVTTRLFQFSSSGRLQLWKGALDGFAAHPLAGSGGGTFWELWPRYRHRPLPTGQAHSIVFGTLAELGAVGMALLGVGLLTPLAAAIRLRSNPLVAPAAGSYAAWLAHAATDWDWQLLAVGSAGLLIGGSIVVQLGGRQLRSLGSMLLAGASVVAGALMFYALLGDRALATAQQALAAGNTRAATHSYDRAAGLAPWSSAPDQGRASVALIEGDKELAVQFLERAIRKDPNSWALWHELAQLATGRTRARASQQFRRLNPYP